MSNCSRPYDLGCFRSCEAIPTPFVANETGMFTICYKFLSGKYDIPMEGVEGENLTIPNLFPEKGCFDFQIKKPDGTLYGYEQTLTENNCCGSIGNRIENTNFRIEKVLGGVRVEPTKFCK